jgi:hypothetical protein
VSEDFTLRVRQVSAVEYTIACYDALVEALGRLNPDILDEDAVDNLRLLCRSMRQHVEDLDRSTYKLLD